MISTIDALSRPALVTGASRGLGRAIAIALGEMGYPVIVNYLANQAAAQSVVTAITQGGGHALAIGADVSREPEVERLFVQAREAFGPPTIVVNNAGIGTHASVTEISPADFDSVIANNLRSAFLVTQAAVPDMMSADWGRLVFMSSTAARIGGIVSVAYAASKAGIEGLMHYYATHLLTYGITANAVAPALFETDMVAGMTLPPTAALPLGRLGRPEEIGLVVKTIVLCEYMTGQTIQVNAGRYHT